MTITEKRIYLASRSPRRRELLKQIGISFEVLLCRENPARGADVDETPLPGEPARDYVTRITRAKTETCWRCVICRKLPRLPVLAADTAVALEGVVIGKPADRDHAAEMLRRLSGREHQVFTAVAVAFENEVDMRLSESAVTFRELTDDEIRRYIATGETLDKAGAYAVQGRAAAFISAIRGSYSGVMGLPLFETAELLKKFGYE